MSNWLQRLLGKDAPDPPARAMPAASRAPAQTAAAPSPQPRPAVDVDAAFCRWLLGQESAAAQTSSPSESMLLTTVESTALTGQAAAALVPRVPTLVPQLLRSLRDPSGSMTEVARQVAHDPVLVAAVLKVANSPYYRPSRPIASIEQALLVLGQDTLRQMLARIAFKPILNLQSGTATKRGAPLIWDQSERCGVACHVLAPTIGGSAFEAFLAALLQNVGSIVMLRILDNGGYVRQPGYSQDFCRALMGQVRRFAHEIGVQWSFPPTVIEVIAPRSESSQGAGPTRELFKTCDYLSKARVLCDGGQLAVEDLGLDDGPVGVCFGRLVKEPDE
jgi:HD-like signal output (HDOD) protein